MNITEEIIASTKELFSSYVSLGATPGTPCSHMDNDNNESIIGTIDFSGDVNGHLSIRFPVSTAVLVACAFLYLETDDLQDEDIKDALGELANILAGQVKASIDPQGSKVHLSLPKVLTNHECTCGECTCGEQTQIPFYLDEGEFTVEVKFNPPAKENAPLN